jgi:hypothetical protein
MKVDIKSVQYRVKLLLINYPRLRDSDEKLIANIWADDVSNKQKKIEELTAKDFILLFTQKCLTHPESIRRVRQSLQAKYKDLRGHLYNLRLNNQENVKADLNDVTNEIS